MPFRPPSVKFSPFSNSITRARLFKKSKMPSPLPILSSARQRRPPPLATPGVSSPTPLTVAGPELARSRTSPASATPPGASMAGTVQVKARGRGLLHAAAKAAACRGDGGGEVQVLSRAAAADPGVSPSVRKMDPRPIYFGFWCLITNTTKLN